MLFFEKKKKRKKKQQQQQRNIYTYMLESTLPEKDLVNYEVFNKWGRIKIKKFLIRGGGGVNKRKWMVVFPKHWSCLQQLHYTE